jgi:hypothetical protein
MANEPDWDIINKYSQVETLNISIGIDIYKYSIDIYKYSKTPQKYQKWKKHFRRSTVDGFVSVLTAQKLIGRSQYPEF